MKDPLFTQTITMCHVATGESFDRPIIKNDMEMIRSHYEDYVTREDMIAIYDAITDKNHPQPAVLVMICDLLMRHQQGDTGYYPLVIAPFSAMNLDNGERIQSKEMYSFHTVFESFALAQRNVGLLNDVLSERFGGKIVLFCDCGCGFRMNSAEQGVDDIINDINAFRAYYEAIGTKVTQVEGFDDAIRAKTPVDLGKSEKEAYLRMYAILISLPHAVVPEPAAITLVRNHLKKISLTKVVPTSRDISVHKIIG